MVKDTKVVIEYLEDIFFAHRQEHLAVSSRHTVKNPFLILEIESAKSPSLREYFEGCIDPEVIALTA
jgi:hypothetical protein